MIFTDGDSRMSPTSGLYAAPSTRIFASFTALPRSFNASAIRPVTHAGICALMSSASSSTRN